MKRIVICGSMRLIEHMKALACTLEQRGFTAVIPQEDEWDAISPDKVHEYKRMVSLRYFHEVAQEDTHAILVMNEPNRGIENYIGANAFAEVAIAFFHGKSIFLLHDVYEPFADELTAWGAIPLHGSIDGLQ